MRFTGSVALALVIVTACSSPQSERPALIGDWEMVEGTLEGGLFPLVDGHRITISFSEDGTIGGVAACNSYGGTYVADGEDVLVGDELASTAMGCVEPGVMESESAFLTVLRQPLTYVVDGDEMTIGHPSGELVFRAVQPVQTAALVDTSWQLETLVIGDTATSVMGEATLLLGAGGTVTGSTGCRSFSGEYVIDADTVLFTTFGMAGDCPADMADQDGHIVDVLGDGFTTMIDGDRLTVTSRGSESLVYRQVG